MTPTNTPTPFPGITVEGVLQQQTGVTSPYFIRDYWQLSGKSFPDKPSTNIQSFE